MHIRVVLALLLALLLCAAASAQVIEPPKHYVFLTTIVKTEYFDSSQYSLEGDKTP